MCKTWTLTKRNEHLATIQRNNEHLYNQLFCKATRWTRGKAAIEGRGASRKHGKSCCKRDALDAVFNACKAIARV